jgi:iron complex outermembrane receptor protein
MLKGLSVLAAGLLAGLVLPFAVAAAAEGDEQLSIEEELFFSEEEMVTSAVKHEQRKNRSPNAIHVITAEDIRYSGATRLTDVLRMVPGMNVALVTGNMSTVSIRGFTKEYSLSLLVLVDGRSIYTPLFGGLYWEAEPIFLENIERIEVIRGPAGALYGANSTKGVVNIITKDPEKAEKLLLSSTVGSNDTLIGKAIYADTLGDLTWRLSLGYHEDEGFDPASALTGSGDRLIDNTRAPMGNLKLKYDIDDNSHLEFMVGLLNGDFGREDVITFEGAPNDLRRWYLQTRYERDLGGGSSYHVQAFWNHFDYHGEYLFAGIEADQYDLEFQHNFPLGEQHFITWGCNWRLEEVGSALYDPDGDWVKKHNILPGAFIQDEWSPTDEFTLTTGVKIEDNDFTGTDFSPRIAAVYEPWEGQVFRASYARSYQQPTFHQKYMYMFDHWTQSSSDLFNVGHPYLFGQYIVGNDDIDAQRVDAFELGYRGSFLEDRLDAGVELFYNDYDKVYDGHGIGRIAPVVGPIPPTMELGVITPGQILLMFDNAERVKTYGVEVSGECEITDRWRVWAGYSFLHFDERGIYNEDPSVMQHLEELEKADPQHQAVLGTRFLFDHGFSLNAQLNYVDQITLSRAVSYDWEDGSREIDDYLRLDVRLAKTFCEDKYELSVVGQNLWDSDHREYSVAEVERMFFVTLTARF